MRLIMESILAGHLSACTPKALKLFFCLKTPCNPLFKNCALDFVAPSLTTSLLSPENFFSPPRKLHTTRVQENKYCDASKEEKVWPSSEKATDFQNFLESFPLSFHKKLNQHKTAVEGTVD